MKKYNSLAIIPARGGSKRIPKKNIKHFLGKPIVTYSIDAALSSGLFDEVMISTDDSGIASVGKGVGAKVPFLRSKERSDDFATVSDVILEVLGEYSKAGKKFDSFCCILPTAPFISKKILIDAYDLMIKKRCNSVISVTKFSYPVWRALKIKGGALEMIWPENYSKRSQDLPNAYHDAGQFYWSKTESFLKKGRLFGPDASPYILSESRVQDIDSEEDWRLAEMKYRAMNS